MAASVTLTVEIQIDAESVSAAASRVENLLSYAEDIERLEVVKTEWRSPVSGTEYVTERTEQGPSMIAPQRER